MVNINVGLVQNNELGCLHKVRGSKLPIHVQKTMTYEEVLGIALKKHATFDQYFCHLEAYVMVYPDLKPCHFIPGSNKPFTILDYKIELGKPFSKIDLYLVKEHDLHDNDDDVDDGGDVREKFVDEIDYPLQDYLYECSLNVPSGITTHQPPAPSTTTTTTVSLLKILYYE